MLTAETRYAKSGDVNIAYQVIGEAPIDLILALGLSTHIEVVLELPAYAHFIERLTSFARVITFDKRGMGLSDRPSVLSTFEEQLDDLRAVLDAVGSERGSAFWLCRGRPHESPFRGHLPRADLGTGALGVLRQGDPEP
jgi:pimeloyl-ACP methyl ester carboxylesterase